MCNDLLPPILLVMEDTAVAIAQPLLQERYLIAQTKLYVLGNVEVGLAGSMDIEVVPHTSLHTEADVVESLVSTCTIILVEQGTRTITIDGVVVIIVIA